MKNSDFCMCSLSCKIWSSNSSRKVEIKRRKKFLYKIEPNTCTICNIMSLIFIMSQLIFMLKIFYTRETIRGIRIATVHWLKFISFFMIDWDDWIKKKGQLFQLNRSGKEFDIHLRYYSKCRAISFSIVKSLLFIPNSNIIQHYIFVQFFLLIIYYYLYFNIIQAAFVFIN